jgi:hypothetical protein
MRHLRIILNFLSVYSTKRSYTSSKYDTIKASLETRIFGEAPRILPPGDAALESFIQTPGKFFGVLSGMGGLQAHAVLKLEKGYG